MKIKSIEIEATPEEVDSSTAITQLLARFAVQSNTDSYVRFAEVEPDRDGGEAPASSGSNDVPGVAAEGQAIVRELLSSNPSSDCFIRFLTEAISWPQVKVHGIKPKGHVSGTPLDYSRYLRVRKLGSHFGAFAYVHPISGHTSFRLNFASEDEMGSVAPNARLTPKGHRAYGVAITISDESTLQQAITLARMAYDRT